MSHGSSSGLLAVEMPMPLSVSGTEYGGGGEGGLGGGASGGVDGGVDGGIDGGIDGGGDGGGPAVVYRSKFEFAAMETPSLY